MKQIFFLFFMCGIFCMGQLQTVSYKETTAKGEKVATLQMERDRSVYFSQNTNNTRAVQKADGSTVYPANSVDSIANRPRFVYFDRKKQLFYNNIINRDIETIISDGAKAKWQILDEYKEILGQRCRKASTEFLGNRYTAWFAVNIPLPYGPLKFNGLPGLILELEETSGKLKVVATGITDKAPENNFFKTIGTYDPSKAVTRTQYDDIIKGYLQDSEKELQTALPNKGN